MGDQERKKSVPIYFYYLTVNKQKSANDDSAYDVNGIIGALSKLFSFIQRKNLIDRRYDNNALERVIWLDSCVDLGNGNYNLIFKSAKYNHVRNEIDTVTMVERGFRKRPQDGDEEKTHLCIRHQGNDLQFLAVHESNHYGITLSSIVQYLNDFFDKYNEENADPFHYSIAYESMPGEDFLTSLKKSKSMGVIQLTVHRDDIKDDFMKYAGRDDIASEVVISLKRPKGAKNFPENLIKAYFEQTQDKKNGKIKKVVIKGSNESGRYEVDSDVMRMKHYLQIATEPLTNEVSSDDFFKHAQEFINEKVK